nr:LytTR family DNA-binding domain-containing protein [uncultured Anaerotignum sp.]
MFRIAVCDDNDAVCSAIENIIDGFFRTENTHYEIDSFQSGEELLKELNNHEKYDLIYLDIELAQINGVAVGRYIRENLLDDYTQIAFISAKSSYALELFQVRPIHFLVKPFTPRQVIGILEKAMELQGHQIKIFSYRTGKIENRIPYKDIMYFSSEGKKIIIHMRNGKDTFYGKLSELNLPDTEFMQIHKSFIVNKQFVTRFKFDSVLLSDDEELPISRAYRKTVREKLMS